MRHIHYCTTRYGKDLPSADGDIPPELEPTETKDKDENIFTGEEDTPVNIELRDTGLLEWLKEYRQHTKQYYTQAQHGLTLARTLQSTTLQTTMDTDSTPTEPSGFLTDDILHRACTRFAVAYHQHHDVLQAYIDLYRTTPCLPATALYTPEAVATLCHVICERCRALQDTVLTPTFEDPDDARVLTTAGRDTFDKHYAARFDTAYEMVMDHIARFEETSQEEDFVEVIPQGPVSEEVIEDAIETAVGHLVYLDQKATTYYYLYLLKRQYAAWHTAQ